MPGHLPELLTPEQVADYLQMSVDEVVELLVSGEMPGSRLASKWRIRKGKLDEWIDSQSVNGTSPEKSSGESESSQPVASGSTSESNGINLTDSVYQSTINNSGSGIEIETELETSEATKLTELKRSNPSNTLKEKPRWTPPIQQSEGKEKRLRGTVTRFNLKDGYGFIKGDDGRTFYVSSIDIAGWGQALRRNEKVEFESIRVPQGWAAKNVVSLSNKSSFITITRF